MSNQVISLPRQPCSWFHPCGHPAIVDTGFQISGVLPGWPHPWKNPWNPWISDMSLKSVKSPWISIAILKDPMLKALCGIPVCFIALLYSFFLACDYILLWFSFSGAHCNTWPLNLGVSVEFWHPWKSWKDPWNILELSLNFVVGISWSPCLLNLYFHQLLLRYF